ncbi:hypothetical protein OXE08_004515 [Salmonella enterica]|nr:hypothetical protein [Salmonella enterica]
MKKLTQELKDLALAQVQRSKSQAEGPRNEYLAKCRESYLYEACKKPGKLIASETVAEGASLYVEPVLREAKKEAKPQLLDSFTSDSRLAMAFRSRGFNRHSDLDDLLTFNLNKIFLDDQDGYAVIEKAIDEALGPGSAFIKVYVDEKNSHEEATAAEWISVEDFMSMIADEWVIDAPADFADKPKGNLKGFEWKTSTDKQSGTVARLIRGKIPMIKNERHIKAEFIESKDLWFDTSFGADFERCRYACHRVLTTVGDAEKRGFNADLLKDAAAMDKDVILQELSLTGISDIDQDFDSTDEKEKRVFIYEHYTYSSQFDKSKETKLYQVITTGNEVLEINEISFMPFVHAKKKSVIGSFYAQGFYDEAKPFQDALTKKYRLADQVATMTAYPRYVAVKGAYDKQSMMNSSRPGGVIETQSVDSLIPFPHQTLDQSFITHYEMLRDSEKQSLRRGFGSANLEEIPQLSTATVAMGIYADAARGMELSKSFARTLIEPLYKLIYETMRNEQWPLEDANGKPVEGISYPATYKLTVDINTPGDDAAQAMRLADAIQTAAILGQIGGKFLNDQNKYEMLNFILTRADLPSDKFVTNPQNIPDDANAVEMQKELEAVNHIAAKTQLQGLILDNWNKAAQVFDREQETENKILNSAVERETATQESLARIQQIMNDAQNSADKNAIENKRVNYDALLGAHKQRHDNVVNGIM